MPRNRQCTGAADVQAVRERICALRSAEGWTPAGKDQALHDHSLP